MSYALITIAALITLLIVYSYFKIRKIKNMPVVEDSDKLHVLTDKNFNNQIKSGVTIVDFWAPWCMPCKMMAPVLNDLANSVNANQKVAKLNVDQYQSIAARYNVRSIPTLILFKNGKEVERIVGVKSKDYLAKQMQKYA